MIKSKQYPSGVRLVVETLKGFPSVVANITVGTGSNDDPIGKEGIAHFFEHMAFKGTTTKSSSEISNAFERVGSVINAATSNNFVKFYVKCIAEDASFCFELLSDVFLNSTLPEFELEKERLVILQELAMIDDDPEQSVSELLAMSLYQSSSLGNPVGGFIDTVSRISRQDLLDFRNNNFVPEKTVISFAGDISFSDAEAIVDKFFISRIKYEDRNPFCFPKKQVPFPKDIRYTFRQKHIMQNHVLLSFPSTNVYHKNSTKMLLLSFFLGGGMSSRLFQRVREKYGLVYSIFCYDNAGISSGDFEIYFATENKNLMEAFSQIKQELELVCKEGIPDDEFNKIKKFLKNLLLMMRENLDYIASGNAKDILCYGKTKSVSKEIHKMAIIKKQDLELLAKKVFDWEKSTIAIVGQKVSRTFEREWIK